MSTIKKMPQFYHLTPTSLASLRDSLEEAFSMLESPDIAEFVSQHTVDKIETALRFLASLEQDDLA